MKVAVSSTGSDLTATIDERFGRCRYLLLIDTDNMACETIENANADLTSSAGIQSAGLVADKGATVVITGNCGPKAMQVFNTANIRVIVGQHGIIQDVIEKFKKGKLDASTGDNRQQPLGTAATGTTPLPRGSGRGGGRGMGGGRGRGGCGGGMGMGRRCMAPDNAVGANRLPGVGDPSAREMDRLQQQADDLKRQLADIEAKIKQRT